MSPKDRRPGGNFLSIHRVDVSSGMSSFRTDGSQIRSTELGGHSASTGDAASEHEQKKVSIDFDVGRGRRAPKYQQREELVELRPLNTHTSPVVFRNAGLSWYDAASMYPPLMFVYRLHTASRILCVQTTTVRETSPTLD